MSPPRGGVLLLDKPLGLSSNAALQRVRTLAGRIKGGHVGSLDPLATGMLPVCLGEATKVAGDIVSLRKCYRFTVSLGTATATGDAEGAVTAQAEVPPLEGEALRAALARFRGTTCQVPPMYSAIKQAGQPLYRLARAGLEVPRAAREVTIDRLEVLEVAAAALSLEVLCSKGTYVRVLAQDIAHALNTVGHVTHLRRVYVEPFEGHALYTLESLAAGCARGEPLPLLPIDAPLSHLPAQSLSAPERDRLLHGQRLAWPGVPEAPRVRLYGPDREFLGLGCVAGGVLRPQRLLAPQAGPGP